jgi:hypothetical protein
VFADHAFATQKAHLRRFVDRQEMVQVRGLGAATGFRPYAGYETNYDT